MNDESKNRQRAGPVDRLRALIPGPAKSALRALASIPARIGHSGRRRRALRRLDTQAGAVRSVLVMCTGNICRSPYVALRLEQRFAAAGADLVLSSGGFLRSDRPSPEEARLAARRRGVDLEGHRSRQIGPEDLAAADLIVVMEREHGRRVVELAPHTAERILLLGELDPAAFQTPEVPDPWGHPAETFDHCYTRLDRCTEVLAGVLRRGTGG